MALSGVHIAFGQSAFGLQTTVGQPTLPYACFVSQTMASAGTSTINAPSLTGVDGVVLQTLLSISASAPIFYATGPNPNASGTQRRYMDPAFGREDIFVNGGDYFAWVFA
jgi:hypothetical protein